jgi:hypothetical protein
MATYTIPLPIQGVNRAYSPNDAPAAYSDSMNNVFPTDAAENRLRLSKRPGMAKWSEDQVGGVELPIVSIGSVSSIA